jgi:hypothetical protein
MGRPGRTPLALKTYQTKSKKRYKKQRQIQKNHPKKIQEKSKNRRKDTANTNHSSFETDKKELSNKLWILR